MTTKLWELERDVEDYEGGFDKAGTALRKIRDGELYKERGFTSFDAYCRDRLDMSRRTADRLVKAADIMERLRPIGLRCGLPSNESQCRILAKLDPEKQAVAWEAACKSAPVNEQGESYITAKMVQRVVRQLEPQPDEPQVPDEPTEVFEPTNRKWLEKRQAAMEAAATELIEHLDKFRRLVRELDGKGLWGYGKTDCGKLNQRLNGARKNIKGVFQYVELRPIARCVGPVSEDAEGECAELPAVKALNVTAKKRTGIKPLSDEERRTLAGLELTIANGLRHINQAAQATR